MASMRGGARAFDRASGITRVAACLLCSALLWPLSVAQAAPSVAFDFESDPGDYIGGGVTYHRTQADGALSVSTLDATSNGLPDRLTIVLTGTGGVFVVFQLATDQLGHDFVPGTYLNAERASFATAGHPGIDVGMDGRGCNTLTGSFVIHAVHFQGMTLRYLDLDFVQHCEGAMPALRGSVLYADGGPTTTVVVPASPTVQGGTPATLTATVTGLGPTGAVEFRDGLATIAACASVGLVGGGSARTAQCVTSSLGNGSHTITARYSGDPANLPSSGTAQLQVTLPGCAGFGDIDVSSPFCQHVEWIRNRSVTQGCTASAYCPNDGVSRLAMAAFLARLGAALTPVVLNVDATTGALPLALSVVSCQTSNFVVTGFIRRAHANAVIGAKAAANVDLGVELVASFDDGQQWVAIAQPSRAGLSANRWTGVGAIGSADLAVGQSVRFGVRFGTGGAPWTGDLIDSTCQLRVEIANRN
jgi:hypothetical protein